MGSFVNYQDLFIALTKMLYGPSWHTVISSKRYRKACISQQDGYEAMF